LVEPLAGVVCIVLGHRRGLQLARLLLLLLLLLGRPQTMMTICRSEERLGCSV